MSAAFPDVTPNYPSVSPTLAEGVHENLLFFVKLSKSLLELSHKIAAIQDEAASNVFNVVDAFTKKLPEVNKQKFCPNESLVKFLHRILEQMKTQAETLHSVGATFADCVITPLQEIVERKREVWKTCFYYVQSYQEQIQKKEDDLVKRYKEYSDATAKTRSTVNPKTKQVVFYNNSHNTYLLRLSSVNSINNLHYTHVLPHVLYCLEKNQAELNDSLRHHVKYMFSVQKETFKKLLKSNDKMDHAAEKIDIVSDFKKFVKHTMKEGLKDKNPPKQEFSAPRVEQGRRASVASEKTEEAFIVNKFTRPNLHRRLAYLQYQTNQLVDAISSMRAGDSEELRALYHGDDPCLNEVIDLLCICDKEANLNVLLKQMELYTPEVVNYLGPPPANIMQESKHSHKSPVHQPSNTQREGEKPHEFAELPLMKPLMCFYCSKLISLISKGFVCKLCKMPVHKKCAVNVPFCDGVPIKQKNKIQPAEGKMAAESSVVTDLIDLESDYENGYDDDEFYDGLSDTEEEQPVPPPLPTRTDIPQSFPSKPVISTKPLIPIKAHNPGISAINKPLPNEPADNKAERRHTMPAFPVVPTRVFKPFSNEAESVKPKISKKPAIATKPKLLSSSDEMCVTLYDFDGTDDTHLSLKAGCKIELLEKGDTGWWCGRYKNKDGFFPSQYVLLIDNKDVILRSLYDFQAEDKKELSLDEGQILVLMHKEDGWFKVRSVHGEGLVPASYIEHI